MTARKPKPKPRKASGPTHKNIARAEYETDLQAINRNFDCAADWLEDHKRMIDALEDRIETLESRDRLRDKSHDEPVSNAGEAIGQHFRITGEVKRPWWRLLLIGRGEA